MKKSTILWCCAVLIAALLSSALTRLFYKSRQSDIPSSTREVALIDWDTAELPEDMQEATTPTPILNGNELPSQLAAVHMPEGASIQKPGENRQTSEDGKASSSQTIPLNLREGKDTIVPLDNALVEDTQEEESHRTLIQAPVRYQLINTLEEYKNFKRKARGSYPEVNFATSRVLVLESDSELPDSLFEIVEVTRQGDKVLVTYRVDVIGFNKKTNTHSVKVLKKSNREIELKQVL